MPDMYVHFGGYQHPPGEVNIRKMEIIPYITGRGRRWAALKKLHCTGDLQFTEAEDATIGNDNALRQSMMQAKIQAFINAYDTNYKNFGLVHGDGTPTNHYLEESHPDNISGVRVLYRSWPEGGGDQYVTARTFYFVVGAMFDMADSQIYAFRERVRILGTAGQNWEWIENQQNVPIYRTIQPFTHQTLIQEGSIVGVNGWPLGDVPAPLFPTWEHGKRRVQEYEFPHWHGKQYRIYGYTWRYYMEAPTAQVAIPNLY